MKHSKQAMLRSLIALLLCVSMFVGTTFAWFTDSVFSMNNIIQAGNLDIELEWYDPVLGWLSVNENTNVFPKDSLWEPGHTEVVYLRIKNAGSLALKYQLGVHVSSQTEGTNVKGEKFKLSDYIMMGAVNTEPSFPSREAARNAVTTSYSLTKGFATEGEMQVGAADKYVALVVYMPETVGNEANYRGDAVPTIHLGISLLATQLSAENDSFGPDYDDDAQFPVLKPGNVTVDITGKVANGALTEAVNMVNPEGNLSAVVPAGTKVTGNALTLRVSELSATGSNVTLKEDQILRPMDVHIDGVAEDNEAPIQITVKEAMMKGLNIGNYALYHVEGEATNEMTPGNLNVHNGFTYDPATGDLTLALATFSEITMVAEPAKWEGNFDYSWYTNAVAPVDSEGAPDYVIANADQLAAFGAIVGGMDGQTQNSFAGKTVKLISDINLGDKESENNSKIIFYPIGYYNSEGTYERTNTAITSGLRNFEGTFDGNGHTVSNFYQNTWEMKGDHNWYDATLQYYRDGMGLFGRVYKGTVKNLTVKNFSSDGEIATTGVIAAYADGATFENIAIFDCNPRVYNIGNGGIVGCVGWYAKEADLKTTFTNITVDNSNKISALWGSYDVACGGIVGQYYPTSGQTSAGTPKNAGIHFENCHVSAVMDVYNDVCANYQYYAYRYTGMLIGSVRENETIDGHVYPKMDGITASDCTVHFGTWNDYYYCEIIDNSTASYTHDYQMSRLTEIKAIDGTDITYLDGTTGTVPASGRANYVIVDYTKGHGTDNATCYHFKNGAVWTHDMGGIQTGVDENGDGKDDLKEDKQHIYLEFNNLVTGYGWGVTSKGVGDLAGVTILDREVGNSVEKFMGKVTELSNNKEYKLGDLFNFVNNGVELIPGALTVSVTNLDESNPVSAEITYDRSASGSWENGTITFAGTGKVTITIQDYYFCTPTTITVEVKNAENVTRVDRFAVAFPSTAYVNRVGNQNSVALGKLFTAKDGIGDNVTITFETVIGATVDKFTVDATKDNWSTQTVKFSNTGIIKVTISDDNFSTPVTQYLEVVDAVNVTTATNATSNNVVLLNDVDATSLSIKDGWTFYGNGFEVKFAGDGSYRSAAVSYGFVTIENGGILDNIQVICKIFPEAYMFAKEMTAGTDGRYPYGYSAVVISGNSAITNSYIYGARNNIQVGKGNVTIQNTVTECGSLSNIHIMSEAGNNVVLDNVTTIQRQVTDDFGAGNTMLGFGILVGTNETKSYPTIKISGDLRQYNWVSKADADKVSNAYAKQAINGAITNTNYVHTLDGISKINFGIVFLTTNEANIQDSRADSLKTQVPYFLSIVSLSGYSGQVYSVKAGSQVTDNSRYNAETDGRIPYTPSAQRVIEPQVSHSGVNGAALTINTAYNNAWVTTFTADLDNITGGSYNFTFNDLVIKKYGKDLAYTVKDTSGNTVDKSAVIALNQLYTGEYTLIITDDVVYNSNGQLSDETVTHEMPFVLYATKTSIEPPKFEGIGSGVDGAIRLVTSRGGNWRPAYPALQGVSVTYWSASENMVKTVDLSTLTNEGTISGQTWTYTCDDFTLEITGGPVHTTTSYVLSPMIAKRDGVDVLYFAAANKDNTTGTTARLICLEYVFTDKNASTTVGQCTSYSNGIATVQYADLPEFSWSSFQSGTVEAVGSGTSSGGCVTGDTLVTLADGTQKEIQYITYEDQLLVRDFFKGEYATVPASLIVNHGYGDQTIIKLTFEDGTIVKAINAHSFFDATTNSWKLINASNAYDYIGHAFVQADGNSYTTVSLTNVEVYEEYTESYSLVSAYHYNFITENMFSLTNSVHNMLAGLVVGDSMTYDQKVLEADAEEYGLYSYEDFADYISYEQYVAFNGDYLKISVMKGYISFEDILALIKEYLIP